MNLRVKPRFKPADMSKCKESLSISDPQVTFSSDDTNQQNENNRMWLKRTGCQIHTPVIEKGKEVMTEIYFLVLCIICRGNETISGFRLRNL